MRRTKTVGECSEIGTRLAVIENKIEAVLGEVGKIREYIPGKMIEHEERVEVLERNIRSMLWLAGVFAVAIVGAFVAHVFS
jgi:hypothetical protein